MGLDRRSVAPLGRSTQQNVRRAFDGRWIDVFENGGKGNGALGPGTAHPRMLLSYNQTLDAVSRWRTRWATVHTLCRISHNEFVPATRSSWRRCPPLNEALFLDLMLERARNRDERVVLLQHAIDSIASTFYTQVMFADFELQAHRLVEQDLPVTAGRSTIYAALLDAYYGDVIDKEEVSRVTWARIPHFFSTPYYLSVCDMLRVDSWLMQASDRTPRNERMG
jgi:oligoendopeptidase F